MVQPLSCLPTYSHRQLLSHLLELGKRLIGASLICTFFKNSPIRRIQVVQHLEHAGAYYWGPHIPAVKPQWTNKSIRTLHCADSVKNMHLPRLIILVSINVYTFFKIKRQPYQMHKSQDQSMPWGRSWRQAAGSHKTLSNLGPAT